MSYFSPCPQCNSNSVHVAEWYSENGDSEYYGMCDVCGYSDADHYDDPEVAIDSWNRRVSTGYADGIDPTDNVYDKLMEEDWDEDLALINAKERVWGYVDDEDVEDGPLY